MTAGVADLALVAGRFGSLLHEAGVPVTPERSGRFARAVALVEPVTLDELYWCGRATLLTALDQVPTFDATFASVFGGITDPADARGDPNAPPLARRAPASATPAAPRKDDVEPGDVPGGALAPSPPSAPGSSAEAEREARPVGAAASPDEHLATKDFGELTAQELLALHALAAEVVLALPVRSARRRERHAAGDRLDLRATLRRSRRSAGDPVHPVRRRPRQRRRRLVLLLDISGSMEPYARAYLQLLHGAANAARAETFVFATRLTRLTRVLRVANPAMALHRAGREAPDWSGGTRIGAAVKSFLDDYGRRGMARGAVVMILSDGWERGDPAELGEQMARLARLAHRIVWVNPRRAAPGFEPLAGGMAAALPYVDAFVSGHNAVALGDVLASALGTMPPVRVQQQ